MEKEAAEGYEVVDDRTPEELEVEAGRLLVRSAKKRMKRAGPSDAHEVRHLFVAITAGNSDPCGSGGEHCTLDDALLRRLHDLNWPGQRYETFAGIPPEPKQN